MKEFKKNITTTDKVRILLFFLLNFAILVAIATTYINNYVEGRKERYYYIGENQTNVIKDQFELVVSKLEIIENIIYTNKSTDFFDETAKKIYDDANSESSFNIVCITIAPNGIVDKVYPEVGNETLKGSNLLDPAFSGSNDVKEAYENKKMIITDFFTLVQGKEGLAIRKPIIMDDKVWGLVSIAIEKDGFDEQLSLDNLGDMGVKYKLWYENNGKEVIISSNTDKNYDYIDVKMNYHNLQWTLSVCPNTHWIDPIKVILIIFALLLIAILITGLLASSMILKQTNKKLYNLANIDPLSQCYTRNYVRTHLIDVNSWEWKNPNDHYSLVYIDIDYFKNINDVYGHQIGDTIIETVSSIFKGELKENDLVSRFGGDEFVIFFKNITKEDLINKIENIIKKVKSLEIENQKDLHITLSMGVAFYDEEPSHNYNDMIESADKKLYTSKSKGKNQYTI